MIAYTEIQTGRVVALKTWLGTGVNGLVSSILLASRLACLVISTSWAANEKNWSLKTRH